MKKCNFSPGHFGLCMEKLLTAGRDHSLPGDSPHFVDLTTLGAGAGH